MKRFCCACLSFVAVVSFFQTAFCQITFDVETLGGNQTRALGLNDFGDVVGYTLTSKGAAAFVHHAHDTAGNVELLFPATSDGLGYRIANAISNSGAIIGASGTGETFHRDGTRTPEVGQAFYRDRNGVISFLSTPLGRCHQATAINSQYGYIRVNPCGSESANQAHAYLFDERTLRLSEDFGPGSRLYILDAGKVVGRNNKNQLFAYIPSVELVSGRERFVIEYPNGLTDAHSGHDGQLIR